MTKMEDHLHQLARDIRISTLDAALILLHKSKDLDEAKILVEKLRQAGISPDFTKSVAPEDPDS